MAFKADTKHSAAKSIKVEDICHEKVCLYEISLPIFTIMCIWMIMWIPYGIGKMFFCPTSEKWWCNINSQSFPLFFLFRPCTFLTLHPLFITIYIRWASSSKQFSTAEFIPLLYYNSGITRYHQHFKIDKYTSHNTIQIQFRPGC